MMQALGAPMGSAFGEPGGLGGLLAEWMKALRAPRGPGGQGCPEGREAPRTGGHG